MGKRNEKTGLYQRGEVWWLNFQQNGKRHFISLETTDFAEAVARAAAARNYPTLQVTETIATEVDRFIAYKLSHREYTRASSEKGYILQQFAGFVGPVPVAAVTVENVTAYYQGVLRDRKVSTANTYLLALRSFFRWAVEIRKSIRRNPCQEVKVVEDDGAAFKDFCTREQVSSLIEDCADESLRFVLYAGFHAGMRKLEIIEAVPGWFQVDRGVIHLRKTPHIRFKDREERAIPMSPEFRAFLGGYGLRAPYMLHPEVPRARSKYRYEFRRPFDALMARHGLDWVTPHTMRHTFASLLACADYSLYKIAKWLGDEPGVVERTYAKLTPKHDELVGVFGDGHKKGKARISSASPRPKRAGRTPNPA